MKTIELCIFLDFLIHLVSGLLGPVSSTRPLADDSISKWKGRMVSDPPACPTDIFSNVSSSDGMLWSVDAEVHNETDVSTDWGEVGRCSALKRREPTGESEVTDKVTDPLGYMENDVHFAVFQLGSEAGVSKAQEGELKRGLEQARLRPRKSPHPSQLCQSERSRLHCIYSSILLMILLKGGQE
jgi:hypothetical protein